MNAHTFCCGQAEVHGAIHNDERKELTAALLEQIREFTAQNPSVVTHPDIRIGKEPGEGDLIICVTLRGLKAYFVKLGTYWDQVDMPEMYKRGRKHWVVQMSRGTFCKTHRWVTWEVSIGYLKPRSDGGMLLLPQVL